MVEYLQSGDQSMADYLQSGDQSMAEYLQSGDQSIAPEYLAWQLGERNWREDE